jgi:uncharacterized protein
MMRKIALLAASLGFSVPVTAQEGVTILPPPPAINVGARGEVQIQPDRATVHIAVETRATNAAAAASENAAISQRVMAAIRGAGIAADQISTTQYNIAPEYRYEPTREPRLVGYRVTNMVVVEVRDLARVGPVLDAAVGAGANRVAGLRFYAANTEAARRNAITRAIEVARRDAEAMARAAGGTLGALLEAHVGAFYAPPPPPMPPMMRAEAAMAADTPITPGEQTLSVDVQTRWRFIAQ